MTQSVVREKQYQWNDAFKDYDESDEDFSKEVTKTRHNKSMIERLTYFSAKKTSINEDDHYYRAAETRYAQTVSWRKRHTPAF